MFLIQVTNQTGQPEAVTYGCKKYRVRKETLIERFVKEIVKDHGFEAESGYMRDKMLTVRVGIGDALDETFVAWDGDRLKDRKLEDLPFSDSEAVPNRVAIMKNNWKMEDPGEEVREIDMKDEEEEEVETEWALRGMTRAQWTYETCAEMSREVGQVADKWTQVLQEHYDARKNRDSLRSAKNLPHVTLTQKCSVSKRATVTAC
jgi:hypothetical protein